MMLTKVRCGEAVLEVDVEATGAAYSRSKSEPCLCAYCRNVRAQWPAAIPAEIRAVLTPLGIDPQTSTQAEIIDFGAASDGTRIGEVEWPYIGPSVIRPDTAATSRQVLIRTPTVVTAYPGGAPCGEAFDTDCRWSVTVTFVGIRWVLDEPEPSQ